MERDRPLPEIALCCHIKNKKNVYIIHGVVKKKGASPDRDLHTDISTQIKKKIRYVVITTKTVQKRYREIWTIQQKTLT